MKSLPKNSINFALISFLTITTQPLAVADEAEDRTSDEEFDVISVTASRIERKTKEVAGSIDVIDSERIESEKMFNIKDAIQGAPAF